MACRTTTKKFDLFEYKHYIVQINATMDITFVLVKNCFVLSKHFSNDAKKNKLEQVHFIKGQHRVLCTALFIAFFLMRSRKLTDLQGGI